MNIEIIDNANIVSKTQKQKLRKKIVNDLDILERKNDILNSIVYHNNENGYDNFKYTRNGDKHIIIEFFFELKTDLKKKYDDKMKFISNKHKKDWQLYDRLKRMVPIDGIPTPDEVRKKSDEFYKIVQNNKNNPVTQYIQSCLESQ